MSERFIVATVTGYAIEPEDAPRRPDRGAGTAYAVLDTAVCFQIVEHFPAHRSSEHRAQELCDRLNKEDACH